MMFIHRPAIAILTATILVVLIVPAMAQDAEKTDPRVKLVEEQIERESKQIDLDEKHAKEQFVAAHQKQVKARITVLTKAVATCESKMTAAKTTGDKKSQEAIEAKKSDLVVELEALKTASEKKWDVSVVEADGKTDTKEEASRQNIPQWLIGKWDVVTAGNNVRVGVLTYNADGSCEYETGGKKYAGKMSPNRSKIAWKDGFIWTVKKMANNSVSYETDDGHNFTSTKK